MRRTRRQWAAEVRRWRGSGLTSAEYARRKRLNARTLLWWSSKLKREGRRPAAFVEVVRPRSAAQIEPGRIEVVVRERVRICVSGAFDAALLRRVVAAFEAE